MKKIKLLFIDPVNNHNKFYNMEQIDANNFRVIYGRVGSNGVIVDYPMRDWDTKLKEKTRKGYKNITDDYIIKKIADPINQTKDGDISTLKPNIRKQIELLHKYANQIIKSNYTVEITDVTEGLVKKAQDIINDINSKLDINADLNILNILLIKLFNVIPRKMLIVRTHLFPNGISTQSDLNEAINRMQKEQDLLDVLKGQLQKQSDPNITTATPNSKVLTYLDKLGLDLEEVSPSEEKMLKDMMDFDDTSMNIKSGSKYISAYKVTNFNTQKAFDKDLNKSTNKTTKLLFHGSNSGNWLNILKQGLTLRSEIAKSGGLFNKGIYFADVADKSLGYISGGRWNGGSSDNDNWLAVYEVHTGNAANYKNLPEYKSSRSNNTNLTTWIPDNDFDSYHADRKIEQRYSLRRDEFIIYDENKCTIKYLIHL